ncbi:hypothetical protein AYO44_17430 [Planctomycetaceae bacterium SCGC AG-212-F19]|nr:hypothetical protein AYO44_17430 [Planctomycetaceae bacterium SCGC AG-212-F19]
MNCANFVYGLLSLNLGSFTPVFVALGIGAVAAALVFVAGRFFFKGQPVAGDVEEEEAPNLEPRPAPEDEYNPEVVRQSGTMDRRQALRRGGNPVAVFLTDAEAESKPVQAYVLDRSTGGICLTVPEAVQAGTVLSVRAVNAPPATPWVKVEVRNCRGVGDEFELGCRFLKTPPWNVLLLFG